jgi:hypothetical protein
VRVHLAAKRLDIESLAHPTILSRLQIASR